MKFQKGRLQRCQLCKTKVIAVGEVAGVLVCMMHLTKLSEVKGSENKNSA